MLSLNIATPSLKCNTVHCSPEKGGTAAAHYRRHARHRIVHPPITAILLSLLELAKESRDSVAFNFNRVSGRILGRLLAKNRLQLSALCHCQP
jgi:hypothetical protein